MLSVFICETGIGVWSDDETCVVSWMHFLDCEECIHARRHTEQPSELLLLRMATATRNVFGLLMDSQPNTIPFLELSEVCRAFCFGCAFKDGWAKREMGGSSKHGRQMNATVGFLSEWIIKPVGNLAEWVYFNGPAKFGLWNGVSAYDACAELTRVPADIWKKEDEACHALLEKDFTAFAIGSGMVVSVLFLWKLLDACAWSCALRQLKQF